MNNIIYHNITITVWYSYYITVMVAATRPPWELPPQDGIACRAESDKSYV